MSLLGDAVFMALAAIDAGGSKAVVVQEGGVIVVVSEVELGFPTRRMLLGEVNLLIGTPETRVRPKRPFSPIRRRFQGLRPHPVRGCTAIFSFASPLAGGNSRAGCPFPA